MFVEFEAGSQLVSVGKYAFKNAGVRRIVLPANLRAICDGAFKRCMILEEVTFEAGSQLVFVGKYAFENCEGEGNYAPCKRTRDKYRCIQF